MDSEEAKPQAAGEEDYEPSPWHFKLLFVALVLYLGYRLIQLIVWSYGKLF